MKLCECGCGQPAPIASVSNRKWGHLKGHPVRFVKGHHQRKKRPDVTNDQVLWLAGLLEGEGSFIISKRRRKPKTRSAWVQQSGRISVKMNDKDVIEKVAICFGTKPNKCTSKTTGKVMYVAYLDGAHAFYLMRLLFPHMGIRRQGQINKCLALDLNPLSAWSKAN